MLIFRYGTMGSSKTANAIMHAWDYEHRGLKILFVKPSMENRDGINLIKSRIGLSRECILWDTFIKKDLSKINKIIIDEAQFLTKENIDYLADLVDKLNIDIICYGLRTDFQLHFFEGSQRLFEIADKLEELETTCWCGCKAIVNARINEDGNIIKDGNQIMLGGNDKYIALCRKHYNLNQLS